MTKSFHFNLEKRKLYEIEQRYQTFCFGLEIKLELLSDGINLAIPFIGMELLALHLVILAIKTLAMVKLDKESSK